MMRIRQLLPLMLMVFALVPVPPASALQAPDPVQTPIAFQPFEHGFMLWRQDQDKIVVVFTDIKTKTGAACQETYRDTFDGQAYEIPAAPPGLTVPTLGFGWLYKNDAELAKRLGYAKSEEVSRVADIRVTAGAEGGQVTEITPTEAIEGQPETFKLGGTDEPGLTYCFARHQENRAALNTWVARQQFEHGYMLWRQDRPDRIEVIHDDTEYAPELRCVDTFMDAWKPGMELSYGDLAVPGKRLPTKGFGKIWLENEYVRQSLGYPTQEEDGGFVSVTFEPFQHPTKGSIQIRQLTGTLSSGRPVSSRTFFYGATSAEQADGRLNTGCQRILIPHKS